MVINKAKSIAKITINDNLNVPTCPGIDHASSFCFMLENGMRIMPKTILIASFNTVNIKLISITLKAYVFARITPQAPHLRPCLETIRGTVVKRPILILSVFNNRTN